MYNKNLDSEFLVMAVWVLPVLILTDRSTTRQWLAILMNGLQFLTTINHNLHLWTVVASGIQAVDKAGMDRANAMNTGSILTGELYNTYNAVFFAWDKYLYLVQKVF